MPMEKSSSSHGISVGNSNSLSETNGEAVDLDDNVNVEQVHFAKRKRKETSKVWKEFIKVKLPDGTFKQVECSHCHGRYNKSKSGSTTHMLRHLDACLARKGGEAAQSTLNFQPADSKVQLPSTFSGKYEHPKQREAIAHWILMHEKPFSVTEEQGFTFMMQFSFADSVTYINKTEGRMIKFAEIVKQKHISARKLIIDCPTRWNSTYEMLVAALKFKDVFPGYQKRDSGFKTCPTKEEWTKIENVCDVLGVFYDVTQVISGSEYPTSNLFLSEVLSVKEVLDEKLGSEHVYIQEMVKKMLDKFKKYWGDCNLLMALGTVLDPRFKLKFIKFAYPCLYSGENSDPYVEEVKVSIYKLFAEYVEGNTSDDQMHSSYVSSSSTVVSGVVEKKGGRERPRSKFSKYVRTSETVEASKSELDMYLEDPVLTLHENSDSDANSGNSGQYADFDVLDWWRSNKLKYRILSRLAIDILAIPITTVASEATFSAGSRVIDEYRAKLGTETVQICICGGDWVRHLHGMKKKARDDKAIQVDLPIA